MKTMTYMTAFICMVACNHKTDKNPLLEDFKTVHHTPPFDRIRTEHYEPAFEKAIADARKEIEQIAHTDSAPDFENTIAALDRAGERLGEISSIFFNLNSACTNDEMQQIAQRISPKLTEYSNSIYMDPILFKRVKQVYENREEIVLTPEQATLLEDTWKAFIKGGANLEEADRERYKEVSMEISRLGLKFDENLLAETNGYTLHITDEKDLAGLPESAREQAALTAKEKNLEGWVFTLHAPSYIPFLKYEIDENTDGDYIKTMHFLPQLEIYLIAIKHHFYNISVKNDRLEDAPPYIRFHRLSLHVLRQSLKKLLHLMFPLPESDMESHVPRLHLLLPATALQFLRLRV